VCFCLRGAVLGMGEGLVFRKKERKSGEGRICK
jgi:hypothetical protein